MPVHNYNIQKMAAVHHHFEDHLVQQIVEDYLRIDEDSDRVITEGTANDALQEWCLDQAWQVGVDLAGLEFDENHKLIPNDFAGSGVFDENGKVLHARTGQVLGWQSELVADYLKALLALEEM